MPEETMETNVIIIEGASRFELEPVANKIACSL